MKVIDLLNMIANGEEMPKKIKWKNREYKYVNEYKDYSYDNAYCFFEDDLLKTRKLLKYLNDEVEIIEEDKKIKNIGTIYFSETPTEAILHRKIEEIIDYINKEEK